MRSLARAFTARILKTGSSLKTHIKIQVSNFAHAYLINDFLHVREVPKSLKVVHNHAASSYMLLRLLHAAWFVLMCEGPLTKLQS